jgi:integrase
MGSLIKQQIVTYVDAEGRRVPKEAVGARKVKTKSSKWYGQFVDANEVRRRVPLCTDKVAARQMLAALEREAELGRAGVTDKFAAHRSRSIDEHVADYETSLRNVGVSAKHLSETMRRLRTLLSKCEVRRLGDLSPENVERFLGDLAEGGAGARTRNTYLTSAKAFLNWCLETKRTGEDALVSVAAANGEVRRKRRALEEEELGRLLLAARERPLQEALTVRKGPRRGERYAGIRPEVRRRLELLGRERALIYKTAIMTGLRRGELECLRVEHLKLKDRILHLPGEFTKNGEDAILPIRTDHVDDLSSWLADTRKKSGDLVFGVPLRMNKILIRDLAWAGIPYRDEHGRVFDFHSLRHTTASHMGKNKVTPRVAQGFMRHSDIRLTMQTYCDPRLLEQSEALAALPGLSLAIADGPNRETSGG